MEGERPARTSVQSLSSASGGTTPRETLECPLDVGIGLIERHPAPECPSILDEVKAFNDVERGNSPM